MNEETPFVDPADVLAMEQEHLPLWRAFLRLFSHLLHPGMRIMDFGCNRGGMLALICREGSAETGPIRPALAVGVEVDAPAMRALLSESAGSAPDRSSTLFTTASPRSFPGQFDLIVSHEVVYLLPDLRATFGDIHAALTKGGHFCFATGCHTDNPLFPRWRTSLEASGIAAYERSTEEYESALRSSGFIHLRRDRLLLTPAEYDAWVLARGSTDPNPSWFPGASAEREYYTRIGKMVLTAEKG